MDVGCSVDSGTVGVLFGLVTGTELDGLDEVMDNLVTWDSGSDVDFTDVPEDVSDAWTVLDSVASKVLVDGCETSGDRDDNFTGATEAEVPSGADVDFTDARDDVDGVVEFVSPEELGVFVDFWTSAIVAEFVVDSELGESGEVVDNVVTCDCGSDVDSTEVSDTFTGVVCSTGTYFVELSVDISETVVTVTDDRVLVFTGVFEDVTSPGDTDVDSTEASDDAEVASGVVVDFTIASDDGVLVSNVPVVEDALRDGLVSDDVCTSVGDVEVTGASEDKTVDLEVSGTVDVTLCDVVLGVDGEDFTEDSVTSGDFEDNLTVISEELSSFGVVDFTELSVITSVVVAGDEVRGASDEELSDGVDETVVSEAVVDFEDEVLTSGDSDDIVTFSGDLEDVISLVDVVLLILVVTCGSAVVDSEDVADVEDTIPLVVGFSCPEFDDEEFSSSISIFSRFGCFFSSTTHFSSTFLNPSKHTQLNDPIVFSHLVFSSSHIPALLHSSTSGKCYLWIKKSLYI